MKLLKGNLANIPLIALVCANMFPIYGAAFLGWDAFTIVLLYWAENLIIGFYNILKMVFAQFSNPIEYIGRLFPTAFFIVHYSGFVAVHGLFIFTLFHKDGVGGVMNIGGHPWPCFLVFVQLLFNVIRHGWLTLPNGTKYAVGMLFLSHGVSFVHNYIMGGEYKTSTVNAIMFQPYGRIIVMHVAILGGGLLSVKMGSPVGVLLVLIILKTIIDVKFHLRQHLAVYPVCQWQRK